MHDPESVLTDGVTDTSTALDALDDLFYVFDDEGRLVAWNERWPEVTGYSHAELHGMAPGEFIREQDQESLAAFLGDVAESGSGTFQFELVTKGGESVPFEAYADELTTHAGEVVGRVGIARDVTERAEYAWELEQQNERLEEFASVLTHDLRNPLNVAKGRADMLDDEDENVRAIGEALERIEHIIDDVLTMSRTGARVSDQRRVSLAAMTADVWTDVQRGTAELTVEDDLDVRADASLLQRLLTNLLRNAIEHAGEQVHVRVGSLADERGFYVADDGPGIPEADRGRVFDWTHTTKASGHGVGLTSIQRICEVHGWTVAVAESDAGGARFEVSGVAAPA